MIPANVDITLLVDRGFGDQVLYEVLELLSWNYAYLRANTVKRRTHWLFRQGAYWYGCLPTMRDDRFEQLMESLADVLHQHQTMTELLAQL